MTDTFRPPTQWTERRRWIQRIARQKRHAWGDRVRPIRPLTGLEWLIASLLAEVRPYAEIAELLGMSRHSIRAYTAKAAKKLPGNLPAQVRVALWYRGASLEVLTWEPESSK